MDGVEPCARCRLDWDHERVVLAIALSLSSNTVSNQSKFLHLQRGDRAIVSCECTSQFTRRVTGFL